MRLKGQKTGESIRIIDMLLESLAGVCHTLLLNCMFHAHTAVKGKETEARFVTLSGRQLCNETEARFVTLSGRQLCSVNLSNPAWIVEYVEYR